MSSLLAYHVGSLFDKKRESGGAASCPVASIYTNINPSSAGVLVIVNKLTDIQENDSMKDRMILPPIGDKGTLRKCGLVSLHLWHGSRDKDGE
jgi:hypothetical protein